MIRETFPVGPIRCNCTVLGDETSREAIVVDPGEDIPKILAVLAKHQLTLKQIVVTHAHIDHIAGAHTLKQITGAPVLYDKRDLPLVALMDVQASWFGIPTPVVMPPDDDLTHGKLVKVGGVIGTVLSTPGHTQGSLCIHFPDQNLLLAGDTLFAGTVGRTDLPGGNSSQLLQSIQEHLVVLPETTIVVPGHGEETTIGAELETNPFLQRV